MKDVYESRGTQGAFELVESLEVGAHSAPSSTMPFSTPCSPSDWTDCTDGTERTDWRDCRERRLFAFALCTCGAPCTPGGRPSKVADFNTGESVSPSAMSLKLWALLGTSFVWGPRDGCFELPAPRAFVEFRGGALFLAFKGGPFEDPVLDTFDGCDGCAKIFDVWPVVFDVWPDVFDEGN